MKNDMYVYLDHMVFYAYHGVASQETQVGNEFWVDLRMKIDFSHAAVTDELEGTVSYADIYAAVKEEMQVPSKLLEHVCKRIADRLFRDFPSIEEIEIRLSKRNPPMGADIRCAGVEMRCYR